MCVPYVFRYTLRENEWTVYGEMFGSCTVKCSDRDPCYGYGPCCTASRIGEIVAYDPYALRYTLRENVGAVLRKLFGTEIPVSRVLGYSESEFSWV